MISINDDNNIINIVIYRSTSIGDVTLSSSCLDFLKKLSFNVKVYWIGSRPSLELIKNAYPEVICIELPQKFSYKKYKELFSQIESIDLILDLQKNLRSLILTKIISKKNSSAPIFSYNKNGWSRTLMILHSWLIGRRRVYPYWKKNISYQFQLMNNTLKNGLIQLLKDNKQEINSINAVPRFVIKQNSITSTAIDAINKDQKWIAIAPGAAHQTKQAPEEVFKKILNKISQLVINDKKYFNGNFPGLIFVGDYSNKNISQNLINSLSWQGKIIDFTGKLNLWETTNVLNRAGALLTNDSALSHISEAVNTPVSVLFGPTIENFGFAPHLSNSKAFSAFLSCRPCSKHGKLKCRYNDKKCFDLISFDSVALHLLNNIK